MPRRRYGAAQKEEGPCVSPRFGRRGMKPAEETEESGPKQGSVGREEEPRCKRVRGVRPRVVQKNGWADPRAREKLREKERGGARSHVGRASKRDDPQTNWTGGKGPC